MTSPHRAYDDGDGSASDYAAFEDGPGPHVETSEARTYKTRRVPLGIPLSLRGRLRVGRTLRGNGVSAPLPLSCIRDRIHDEVR